MYADTYFFQFVTFFNHLSECSLSDICYIHSNNSQGFVVFRLEMSDETVETDWGTHPKVTIRHYNQFLNQRICDDRPSPPDKISELLTSSDPLVINRKRLQSWETNLYCRRPKLLQRCTKMSKRQWNEYWYKQCNNVIPNVVVTVAHWGRRIDRHSLMNRRVQVQDDGSRPGEAAVSEALPVWLNHTHSVHIYQDKWFKMKPQFSHVPEVQKYGGFSSVGLANLEVVGVWHDLYHREWVSPTPKYGIKG